MTKTLTCVECPVGCAVEVELENGKVVSVKGYSCPRGKVYAENEVVCPRRVVTSTVRAENGAIIPVKTVRAVKKEDIFSVMEKINGVICKLPVKIGDVLYANIAEDIDLVATNNVKEE